MGAERFKEKVTRYGSEKDEPAYKKLRQRLLKISMDFGESEGPDISDFKLVDNEIGAEVKFSQFLPTGIKIYKAKLFTYNALMKVLYVDFSEMDSLLGGASLLHEAGHAIDMMDPKLMEELDSFISIKGKLAEVYGIVRTRGEYERLSTEEERYRYLTSEAWKLISDSGMSINELLAYIRFLSRLERDAWAQGLRLYRKIKRETGIDIFKGFKAQDIISVPDFALENYGKVGGSLFPEEQARLFLKKKFLRVPKPTDN